MTAADFSPFCSVTYENDLYWKDWCSKAGNDVAASFLISTVTQPRAPSRFALTPAARFHRPCRCLLQVDRLSVSPSANCYFYRFNLPFLLTIGMRGRTTLQKIQGCANPMKITWLSWHMLMKQWLIIEYWTFKAQCFIFFKQ